MNFAINGTCAKGCSFCFTKEEARTQHTLGEMSIEMVNDLISHYNLINNKEDITILGGEPTQHSQFTQIIDNIISKGLKINLVSNFLFGAETRDYIIKNIKHIRWVLPNAAELDEKNRITIFKKNYDAIYNAYANTWGFNESPKLYLAITMSKDWKLKQHYEYIKWLYHQLNGKINAIRLGLDLTGTYLINNKEMGMEITKILKFGLYNDIKITSDCQVPPCLWEGKTKEVVSENSLGFATFKMANYETICGFQPLDIFPDGSAIHCYPLEDKVKIENVLNINGDDKVISLRENFDNLYSENHKNYTLPNECINCIFYKNLCNGICGGCLQGN